MFIESEKIEFKKEFTEEIYKEVIAFANTEGGTIYIGIDNEGNAVGLSNVDKEYTRITNGIRDAIMPDVTMCIKYTIQDNKVVKVSISEGEDKPYFLKGKGIMPKGVYIRQGTSSVQASQDQIKKMILDSSKEALEERVCKEQQLSFSETEKVFNTSGIDFGISKFHSLGFYRDPDGTYTNLAYWLSDQNDSSIKAAVFSNEENTDFIDSKEFKGSLFTQLDEALRYIDLCNKTKSAISGLYRVDKRDYPEVAVREALTNAVIHRDYSFDGSILIKINDKRMEIVSLGGLYGMVSKEDIIEGVSSLRNKKLASVFQRLGIIESYGTGMQRIFSAYKGSVVKPEIRVTSNVFRIILPNINAEAAMKPHVVKENAFDYKHPYYLINDVDYSIIDGDTPPVYEHYWRSALISDFEKGQVERLLEELDRKKEISEEEICKLFNVKFFILG